MNKAPTLEEQRQKTPRVVEIIGPAGAGKTTLYKALGNYPDRFRLSGFPDVRKKADTPFFFWYGLELIPSLLRISRRDSRPLNRREFAWLSILKGWPSVLQGKKQNGSQVIILDQGPIYLMAEMREFGPEFLKREAAEKFWHEIHCRWAAALDTIVCLDTADKYLLERIQTRTKGHIVKNEPEALVYDFLGRYRRTYDYLVASLENCPGGPRVLRFDTKQYQPGDIAELLLIELGHS